MDTPSGYSPGDFIQYKFWNKGQLFPDLGKCSSVGYCDPTSCKNSSDNSSDNSIEELDESTKKLLTAHYDSKKS